MLNGCVLVSLSQLVTINAYNNGTPSIDKVNVRVQCGGLQRIGLSKHGVKFFVNETSRKGSSGPNLSVVQMIP